MNRINFWTVLVLLLVCGTAKAQNMSLSTNLLGYAELGTLNMEASYGFSRHWSANVGMKYNPFTFPGREEVSEQMQLRQRSVALGARFWPWHINSGWWFAGKAQYQEFNQGGLRQAETSEGDRLGGGLSGGYTYMISPHFNFEVGAGIWAGKEYYTSYACPKCGEIIGSGEKTFVLPNDLTLAVIYVF